MESKKKAKILAGVAAAVLVIVELSLFLCFRLSRPFYLSTAVILSVVLAGTAAALLCHALTSPRGRAELMARRRSALDGDGEDAVEVRVVEYSFFRKVAGLPSRFSLAALSAATDDFRYAVGRGSSGTIVADKAREGRVMEVVDRRLVESGEAPADEERVRRMAHVALWCVQEKPSARPDMARVVEMLEARDGGAEVELPPPSEMILVDMLALDPAHAHHGGPFGLPVLSGRTAASSAMSVGESFAMSYLSGRSRIRDAGGAEAGAPNLCTKHRGESFAMSYLSGR
ncbi:hypothetical protein EJB05_46340, partial [Eragrostis curvula]